MSHAAYFCVVMLVSSAHISYNLTYFWQLQLKSLLMMKLITKGSYVKVVVIKLRFLIPNYSLFTLIVSPGQASVMHFAAHGSLMSMSLLVFTAHMLFH